MPNFGSMLSDDPYGSKENQKCNSFLSIPSTSNVPGVLFPGKRVNDDLLVGAHQLPAVGPSFASRSGFASSFRDQAGEVASPHPPRSGEIPRNPLLAKTPTLGNGHVTPRKVSFGSVMMQSNAEGSLAHEVSANLSFAPEASPLGLSRSSYNVLARENVDPHNSTLTPMSVENGQHDTMATGASPAVTFFGVEEDLLSHSTSYVAHTPGKSLLNCSVVSHLQTQDPWTILSQELRNLAYWKHPLASLAVLTVCSSMLLLSYVGGLSGMSVVCGYVLATWLLGCLLHGLEHSLGLAIPALQHIASLPLFQVDAWETTCLAAVACGFRCTESLFAHLRQARSGQDMRKTCGALALLWAGVTWGAMLHAGGVLAALLLGVFAAPCALEWLQPRLERAREGFTQLKAAVQTALLALAACAMAGGVCSLLRLLLLSLSAVDLAAAALAVAVALLVAAHAEGKSPARVLAAVLVSGGKAMGPSALKVLRAIQSPLKDGQRKR